MKILLFFYVIIFAGYGLTEVSILVKNRILFTRKKKDPTAKLVMIPFMLAIAGSPIENHLKLGPTIPWIAAIGVLLISS